MKTYVQKILVKSLCCALFLAATTSMFIGVREVRAVELQGETIAFTSYLNEDAPYIYAMQGDGANLRVIAEGAFSPCWSPDGQKIVFAGIEARHYVDGYDLYIANSDGSDRKRLRKLRGHEWPGSWSPDGKSIVFTRQGSTPHTKIYTMDVSTKKIKRLVYGSAPRWSPDGQNIAYYREISSRGKKSGIYTVSSSGGSTRKMVGGRNLGPFTWIPQTDQLLFSRFDHQRNVFSVKTFSTGATSPFSQIQLPKDLVVFGGLAFSSDAKRLAFIASRGNEGGDLYLGDLLLNTAEPLELPEASTPQEVTWKPNLNE